MTCYLKRLVFIWTERRGKLEASVSPLAAYTKDGKQHMRPGTAHKQGVGSNIDRKWQVGMSFDLSGVDLDKSGPNHVSWLTHQEMLSGETL